MQYVRLSDNSYVLHLSDGIKTFTRKSFNFKKIQKLVLTNADEDEIRPLLQRPELPDGVYEAYILPDCTLVYLHISLTGLRTWVHLKENKIAVLPEETLQMIDQYFSGIYASVEDLTEDWPEFLF